LRDSAGITPDFADGHASRYSGVPTKVRRRPDGTGPPAPGAYDAGMAVPERHREFKRVVDSSQLVDPMPTFRNLSASTGIPVDELVHHALVRWASAGSEALMAIEPEALRELIDARAREDWAKVGGIIDWLAAGR
jgi:hypothetical protein